MAMQLSHALLEMHDIRIFRVEDSEEFDSDNFIKWDVTPIETDVLLEQDGLFILRAFQIKGPNEKIDCFIDLTMPERIADYAYFIGSGNVERKYLHECDGNVICAIPIDGHGVYDLFYSKINPDLGLSVLRRGLELATRKVFIAEDLGYILRDEGRIEEAIEAFSISASEEPSSYFIYHELAELYDQLGQTELSKQYRDKCPKQDTQMKRKPWWKLW
ncbi:MAG: hypothetical protein P8X96_16365 [Desulfobacteraceae bacterium]|jgi:tetratricopeptide (TPR) repeat protein